MSKTAQKLLDEQTKRKVIEELKNDLTKAKKKLIKRKERYNSKKQNKTFIHILSMING